MDSITFSIPSPSELDVFDGWIQESARMANEGWETAWKRRGRSCPGGPVLVCCPTCLVAWIGFDVERCSLDFKEYLDRFESQSYYVLRHDLSIVLSLSPDLLSKISVKAVHRMVKLRRERFPAHFARQETV